MNHGNGGQENKARAARRCREVLSKQPGLITRDQTLAAGLSKRQIETRTGRGEWIALYPGVYADSSSASSWRRSVLAAVFHSGPQAAASGRCAAALLSLPGFRPGKIEITTPRNLRNVPFETHRGTIPLDQLTRIGPIPITDATRTLLDIAALVPEATVEEALDDALRRSLTSLPRLKWLLRSCHRWHASRASIVRDAHKNNALVALGWSVIYLTWEDVEERREVTMGHLRDLLLPRFL